MPKAAGAPEIPASYDLEVKTDKPLVFKQNAQMGMVAKTHVSVSE